MNLGLLWYKTYMITIKCRSALRTVRRYSRLSVTPLQRDFIRSWDKVERFFEVQDFFSRRKPGRQGHLKYVKSVLHTLRRRGYDKTLRAGQALDNLVLSRSVKHGLRQGQRSLMIDFGAPAPFHVWYYWPATTDEFETKDVLNDSRIQNLLTRLLEQPID
jgi:hypothetical protein